MRERATNLRRYIVFFICDLLTGLRIEEGAQAHFPKEAIVWYVLTCEKGGREREKQQKNERGSAAFT